MTPKNGSRSKSPRQFPWNEGLRYLIRDRDRVYGPAVIHRLRAMGIRDKPIAPGSPWQNGFAERLIGSIRRECVDTPPSEALLPLTSGMSYRTSVARALTTMRARAALNHTGR